jgi:hypothetical protein
MRSLAMANRRHSSKHPHHHRLGRSQDENQRHEQAPSVALPSRSEPARGSFKPIVTEHKWATRPVPPPPPKPTPPPTPHAPRSVPKHIWPSGRLPLVGIEHSTEPSFSTDPAARRPNASGWLDELVREPLMIALPMVVRDVLANHGA